MPYQYVTGGPGWVLAPCLQQLCLEIASHPRFSALTNLGELGNAQHAAMGVGSDHNPFIVRNGVGYVRAIDLGGDPNLLLELRGHLFNLYVARDPRVWPFGYFKGPDSLINNWTPGGSGDGWHVDPGDEGHLHISVNQANGYAPTAGGWVAALDSRASWGLLAPAPSTDWLDTVDEATFKRELDGVAAGRSKQVADEINHVPGEVWAASIDGLGPAGAGLRDTRVIVRRDEITSTQRLSALAVRAAAVKAKLAGSQVDPKAVAAALVPSLAGPLAEQVAAALPAGSALDPHEVARDVMADLAGRLAA